VKTAVTVSNALINAIVDGIPVSETQRLELLDGVGLSLETVRDVNARTSILVLARLWRKILRLTQDEFVGLHIGRAIRAERFGLAVHAAQHGSDFRQVLVRFAKYATLVNDLIECGLEEGEPLARYTTRLHWNVLGLERHAVDITFAAVKSFANSRLANPHPVRELRLKHSLVSGRARYEELFDAPVVFAAKRNELVFDAAALDEPVRAPDPELGRILERYAALEMSRIPVVTDLPSRIAQLLRHELEAGRAVDLPAMAVQLEMSPRRLQRRLSERATSFSKLLDDARRELAPTLLAEPDANVEQVGFRLGYSEPTAFIRAFRKWYGTTPGSYRRAKS
jgi:AraC-like DNA-binding protein